MNTQDNPKKNVLVVAYAFPPVGGAGVQRPAKFVKYLQTFSWEPIVLTCSNPSVPVFDYELCKNIPPNTKIYTAKTFEPSYAKKQAIVQKTGNDKATFTSAIKNLGQSIIKNILLPDIQILWWPHLIMSIIKILKKEKIHCIFVTAPPFSSLVPTVFLAKLYKIPVVADFRDEWAFNRQHIENAPKTKLALAIDHFLEGFVLKHTTAITAATDLYLSGMETRHPSANLQHKALSITNGFDPDDFTLPISHEINKKITFVYSGTVWCATSLHQFFKALGFVLEKDPKLRELIRIKIIGRVVDQEKYYLTDEIMDVVTLTGYLSHNQVITEIAQANALILTLTPQKGAERIIPAKTFEYMATGRHILAIIPEGETARILTNNYPNASVISPNDMDKITCQLERIIRQEINLSSEISSSIEKFSRKYLTNQLATLFSKITSE